MLMMYLKTIFKIFRYPFRILSRLKPYLDYCYLKFYGVDTYPGNVVLLGFPIIKKYPGSKIILGKGITLVSKSKFNIAGISIMS